MRGTSTQSPTPVIRDPTTKRSRRAARTPATRGGTAPSHGHDPAPFRGVLPLPISALKSSAPVLGNPANHGRAVPLTYDHFRFAFANAVSEDEAKELYDSYAPRRPSSRGRRGSGSEPTEGMTHDRRLAGEQPDHLLVVISDLPDGLVSEDLRVLVGLLHGVRVVRPVRRQGRTTGGLERRPPPVPAAGQQPSPWTNTTG